MPAVPIIATFAVGYGLSTAAAAVGTAIAGSLIGAGIVASVSPVVAGAIGSAVVGAGVTAIQGGKPKDILRNAVLAGAGSFAGSVVGNAVGTEIGFKVDAIAPGRGIAAANIAEKIASGMVRTSIQTGNLEQGIRQGAFAGAIASVPDVLNEFQSFKDLPPLAQNVIKQSTMTALAGGDVSTAVTTELVKGAIASADIMSRVIGNDKNSDIAKFVKENPDAAALLMSSVTSGLSAAFGDRDVGDAVKNNAIQFVAEKMRQGISSGIIKESVQRSQDSYQKVNTIAAEIEDKSIRLQENIERVNNDIPRLEYVNELYSGRIDNQVRAYDYAYAQYQSALDAYNQGWGSLEEVNRAASSVNTAYSYYESVVNTANRQFDGYYSLLYEIEKQKKEIADLSVNAQKELDNVSLNSFLFTRYTSELENEAISDAQFIADPNKYSLYQDRQTKLGSAYEEYAKNVAPGSSNSKILPNTVTENFKFDSNYNIIDRKTNEVIGKVDANNRAIENLSYSRDPETGALQFGIYGVGSTKPTQSDLEAGTIFVIGKKDGTTETIFGNDKAAMQTLQAEDPMAWFYAVAQLPEKEQRSIIPPEVQKAVNSAWNSIKEGVPPVISESLARIASAAKPETSTLNILEGVVVGSKALSDAFGANNPTSKALQEAQVYIQSLYSAAAKGDQEEAARIMDAAKDAGVIGQVVAGVEAFGANPWIVFQAVGTLAPTLTGAAVAMGLGAPAAVTYAANLGLGVVSGAGIVKGTVYDSTKNALTAANKQYNLGLSAGQIEMKAQEAQAYNGKNLDLILGGGALGAFAASSGLEKLLIKKVASDVAEDVAKKTVARQFVEGGVKGGAFEALPEALQGAHEKWASNKSLQREGFNVPEFSGVLSSAVLEGLAGAPAGSAVQVAANLDAFKLKDEKPPTPPSGGGTTPEGGAPPPPPSGSSTTTGAPPTPPDPKQKLEQDINAAIQRYTDANNIYQLKNEELQQQYKIADQKVKDLESRGIYFSWDSSHPALSERNNIGLAMQQAQKDFDKSLDSINQDFLPPEERPLSIEAVNLKNQVLSEIQAIDAQIQRNGASWSEINRKNQIVQGLVNRLPPGSLDNKTKVNQLFDGISLDGLDLSKIISDPTLIEQPKRAQILSKLIESQNLDNKIAETKDLLEQARVRYGGSHEQARNWDRMYQHWFGELQKLEKAKNTLVQSIAPDLYKYPVFNSESEARALTATLGSGVAPDIVRMLTPEARGLNPEQYAADKRFRDIDAKYAYQLAEANNQIEQNKNLAIRLGGMQPTQTERNRFTDDIFTQYYFDALDSKKNLEARRQKEIDAELLRLQDIDFEDEFKARKFFTDLGMPDPTPEEIVKYVKEGPEAVLSPDVTPESTPAPAPTPDVTPAPEVTVTPEITPDVSPTPEPTPQPQPTPEPQPQPEPSPEPAPQPQPQPEPSPEPQPQPEPQPEPQPQPQPQPTPEPQPQPKPDPQPVIPEPIPPEPIPSEPVPPPTPPVPEETPEEKARKAEAARRAAQRQQASRATLMGGLSAFLSAPRGSGGDDSFGPFDPIRTGGPTPEFKGPLQEFLEKVEGQSYTGQDPFMAPEGQKKPSETDLSNQANQPMPSYFNYGKQSEIDDTLNVARGIDAQIASVTNPFGSRSVSTPMFSFGFADGGLATPLFNQGGATRYGRYAGGGLNVVHHSGKARVDFREGDAVTGPGDGQSDDIPAMLADGEFVFPADVVAALGNGSTKAGSDKLYDMMHSIRSHARSAAPKDLPPPAKASPLDYLKSPKKGTKDRKDRR